MKRIIPSDRSKKTTAMNRRLFITSSSDQKYDNVNKNTRAAATIKNLADR